MIKNIAKIINNFENETLCTNNNNNNTDKKQRITLR